MLHLRQGLSSLHCTSQLGDNIAALLNPETSILLQKRHPYTGNLNRETSGDSKNAFLHWGDVLGLTYVGTHVHNNILVLDLDPVLQVALLFHNLFVDEKSFNLGLSWHRPSIG